MYVHGDRDLAARDKGILLESSGPNEESSARLNLLCFGWLCLDVTFLAVCRSVDRPSRSRALNT